MDDRVFICYSRKDEDFVLKLSENLKNYGVPIWIDQRDIPSGANWNRTIEKALEESTRLLVILSPSSVASDEVQCEWLPAIDAGKVVIPVLYQPCQIPRQLKLIQYIDFTSSRPDDKETIYQILKALDMAGDILKKPIVQPEQLPEPPMKGLDEFRAKIQYHMSRTKKWSILAFIVFVLLLFTFSNETFDVFDIFHKKTASEYSIEGQNFVHQSRFNEALKAYKKSLDLDPSDPFVWLKYGNLSRALGERHEAFKAYNKSLELDPNNAFAWLEYGNFLEEQNRYYDALDAYNKSLKLDPDNSFVWHHKGLIQMKFGWFEGAIPSFNKTIELDLVLDPESNPLLAMYNIGLARYRQGKYNEAIYVLDELIERNNDSEYSNDYICKSAWNLKGLAFKQLSRTTEADAALAKADELEVNSAFSPFFFLVKS